VYKVWEPHVPVEKRIPGVIWELKPPIVRERNEVLFVEDL